MEDLRIGEKPAGEMDEDSMVTDESSSAPLMRRGSSRGIVRLKSEMQLILRASSFAALTTTPGRERALDMDAWGSFLPRMTIEQLQALHAQPCEEGAEPGGIPGSTLDAAVLFADASGFTALTERLAQRPNGAELMCQIMNRFFGSVIDIIHRHCGDVIKFAGDSVFAVFEVGDINAEHPRRAPGMREAVARAASCACALHKELHNFEAWKDESSRGEERTITLSLHIGVGCGTITQLHLGGHHGR